jgi:hypothetical protein
MQNKCLPRDILPQTRLEPGTSYPATSARIVITPKMIRLGNLFWQAAGPDHQSPSSLGIFPASESLVAFTIIMNRMFITAE